MLQSGGVFGAEAVGHSMDIGWHDGVVWWMELANLGFLLMMTCGLVMWWVS